MIDASWDWLVERVVDVGQMLLVAAAWVVGAFVLAHFAGDWIAESLSRRSMGWNGTVLVSRLVSLAIRVIGIILALNVLGVSGTALLTVVTAFTVAIGLSLQDVLKNFFAGVYLALERPFKSGDHIVVRDVTGEVQGVDLRTTLIKNANNELVLVPNATIFTEILRNDTYYGVRRLEFTIKSERRSLRDIEQAVRDGLDSIDVVVQPVPAPRIVSSEAGALTVTMSLVVDNTDDAQNGAAEAVIAALDGDTVEVTSR